MSKDDNYAGPNQRQDTIFVCPRVLNAHSDEFYTKVIVHELAHFCGPEPSRGIGDHGYRNHNLSEQNDPFFKLTPEFAIRTADCYSEFAGSSYLQHEPAAARRGDGNAALPDFRQRDAGSSADANRERLSRDVER